MRVQNCHAIDFLAVRRRSDHCCGSERRVVGVFHVRLLQRKVH